MKIYFVVTDVTTYTVYASSFAEVETRFTAHSAETICLIQIYD
jgi:hypothetical protein